jgi:hypothetical protein
MPIPTDGAVHRSDADVGVTVAILKSATAVGA